MASDLGVDRESLRQRDKSIHVPVQEDARKTVLELNALEEDKDVKDEDKKTFGRTPDGTGKADLKAILLAKKLPQTNDLHI